MFISLYISLCRYLCVGISVSASLCLVVSACLGICVSVSLCISLTHSYCLADIVHHNRCGDPLPAALDVVNNTTDAAVELIKEANTAWWSKFWAKSWISMPKEPKLVSCDRLSYWTTSPRASIKVHPNKRCISRTFCYLAALVFCSLAKERLWYGQMYMIASASREDDRSAMAAGLWGPWVHLDNMYCAGCDFTMYVCSREYVYICTPGGIYIYMCVYIYIDTCLLQPA